MVIESRLGANAIKIEWPFTCDVRGVPKAEREIKSHVCAKVTWNKGANKLEHLAYVISGGSLMIIAHFLIQIGRVNEINQINIHKYKRFVSRAKRNLSAR